mmetsp:Transcript_82918/g.256335  ORF Transcript_82918/g.256335 Transcript_82918/m.256335 type:complete len:243 (-) Transcript_82918:1487-2215(-)
MASSAELSWSLEAWTMLMSCTTMPAMFPTPSAVRMPAPALRMTPDTPTTLAWSTSMTSLSGSLFWHASLRAPTTFSRKTVTNSCRLPPSRRPCSTPRLAHCTRASHVLKAFSCRFSESWMSSRGSMFWQVGGRNSQNSSSRESMKTLIRSRQSAISSNTEVFMPRTLPLTMERLMSGVSSSESSSSGMSAGSTSDGLFFRVSKSTGSSAGTYSLKSFPRVCAILPDASRTDSCCGSSAANPD